MNSFDLFDTLVACRNADRAGEHLDELFPIAETVAQVKTGDIIVSDYYNVPDAARAYSLTGLANELVVTDGGKADGSVWPSVKARGVSVHRGDNSHCDVDQPTKHGIGAELITVSNLTSDEQAVGSLGLAMREARLRTWHPRCRNLQLIQIEYNFPILVHASLALHELAVKLGVKHLLMSARDCFLWQDLMRDIRERLGGTYEIEYFPGSRVVRNNPSPRYMHELNKRLAEGAIIVDVGGTGKSIARLVKRSEFPNTPGFLITRYPWSNLDGYPAIDTSNVHSLAEVNDDVHERANSADHGMPLDWDVIHPNDFWKKEEFVVMRAAFDAARAALRLQPLPKYDSKALERMRREFWSRVGRDLEFVTQEAIREEKIRIEWEKKPRAPIAEPIDLAISVVRGHRWEDLQPYAVSLSRCGFKGKKVMFVDRVDANTQANLRRYGIEVIPFRSGNSSKFVVLERFAPVIAYLKANVGKFRYVIWTDVRDVVFQSDPSAWLEKNIGTAKLIGCSECLLVKDDSVINMRWLENSSLSPAARDLVRENDIICGGTIAGESTEMLGLLSSIYRLASEGTNDQTALCYLLRADFRDLARIPKMSEGFTATCSWLTGPGNKLHGHRLTDALPQFGADGTVSTLNGVPFCIVHQYDRSQSLAKTIRSKFTAQRQNDRGILNPSCEFCRAGG